VLCNGNLKGKTTAVESNFYAIISQKLLHDHIQFLFFFNFIGNLPFTVKEEDVKSHFRCTGKGIVHYSHRLEADFVPIHSCTGKLS